MMPIETFIQQEILAPRMADKGVLVVYDHEHRYHGTCTSMESEHCRVVDASASSITSREQATQALVDLGQGRIEHLLVYVPASAPVDDDAKQKDPFSPFAACGRVFPDGDGDRFESLCLNAKPDQVLELRKVFDANPNPSFAVVDALGGGVGWPTLRALLGVESSRDILLALMAPSPAQEQALKAGDTWVNEARELLKSSLMLTLRTRGRAWSSIAEELWRYVLFSEFAFDLPYPLPDSLADLPKAPEAGRPVVFALCDDLRNDHRTQPVYIDRAPKAGAGVGPGPALRRDSRPGATRDLPIRGAQRAGARHRGLAARSRGWCAQRVGPPASLGVGCAWRKPAEVGPAARRPGTGPALRRAGRAVASAQPGHSPFADVLHRLAARG
ncbi:hypothetical protein [Paraburkholderia youngii]|uniref:hypothetical protein n=1 Tax=Paraburkholderia youngii TaxID=2782701 RepID=UPI003D1EAC35